VSARLRAVVLLAGVGAAAILVFVTVARSPEHVRDLVDGYGVAGPLVFIAVSAALSCSFFPGPLLAGASGLLFGTALGTPVAIAAGTAAAALAFTLSRHGARPVVEEIEGDRIRRWREWVDRRGAIAVFYARIAPAMPFTVVNYAAGLTRLRLAVFAGVTALAISPRAFAYAALGGNLGDLGRPEAIVALCVLVAMGLFGLALLARDRNALRRAGPGTGSSSPAGRSAGRR
jgi:uncharacterized membrane protein YdjX (TVP38/TMEM64 family)